MWGYVVYFQLYRRNDKKAQCFQRLGSRSEKLRGRLIKVVVRVSSSTSRYQGSTGAEGAAQIGANPAGLNRLIRLRWKEAGLQPPEKGAVRVNTSPM